MQFAGVLQKRFRTEEEMIIYSAQMSGFCREQEGKNREYFGVKPQRGAHPEGSQAKGLLVA